jgi:hypothetical protein
MFVRVFLIFLGGFGSLMKWIPVRAHNNNVNFGAALSALLTIIVVSFLHLSRRSNKIAFKRIRIKTPFELDSYKRYLMALVVKLI